MSEGGNSYVWLANGGALATGSAILPVREMPHDLLGGGTRRRSLSIDPMDGGRLLPVAPSSSSSTGGGLTAHRVSVQAGASDGAWTEIVAR